ncbi:MAG: hypothetical protein CMC04_07865 [Flavobacteriaceae bacterium]|nr:hypothetical protein [Flavobacteriaceae bacterium]
MAPRVLTLNPYDFPSVAWISILSRVYLLTSYPSFDSCFFFLHSTIASPVIKDLAIKYISGIKGLK